MKAFILISAIFYFIGLKVGSTVDTYKKYSHERKNSIEAPGDTRNKKEERGFIYRKVDKAKAGKSDKTDTGFGSSSRLVAPLAIPGV